MAESDRELNADLLAAVNDGNFSRVKLLLEGGASPNAAAHSDAEDSRHHWIDEPVLYTACERKLDEVVALLLSYGADANAYLYRYENMQHEEIPALIASFPSPTLVERLLKAGANPNKGHWRREDAGWEQSPLSLAPTEDIRILLRRYGALK